MLTDREPVSAVEGKSHVDISGNYQPIHLQDTVGVIFLGMFAMICLIGWMRTEARYHALLKGK